MNLLLLIIGVFRALVAIILIIQKAYQSNGYYMVNVNGNIGTVTGTRQWWWSSSEDGYEIANKYSGTEGVSFTFSTINGSYLQGTDQDFNEYQPGENLSALTVWFYTPNPNNQKSIQLLDTTFTNSGTGDFWTASVIPLKGTVFTSVSSYNRNDSEGVYTAQYTANDYFTSSGHLIGEIWSESDSGIDTNGQPATFQLTATTTVNGSFFLLGFDGFIYFLAYWLPMVVVLILIYPVYQYQRWKNQRRFFNGQQIILSRSMPANMNIEIQSSYSPLFKAYSLRCRLEKGFIVTANDSSTIIGIGFIEKDNDVGSFFGSGIQEMIQFSGVRYAFSDEFEAVIGMKTIEQYEIFHFNDIGSIATNYDTAHIRPLTAEYIPAVMRMISSEDYGKNNVKYSKWVLAAAQQDIIFIAVIPVSEPWTKEVLRHQQGQKIAPVEIVNNEYIVGVVIDSFR